MLCVCLHVGLICITCVCLRPQVLRPVCACICVCKCVTLGMCVSVFVCACNNGRVCVHPCGCVFVLYTWCVYRDGRPCQCIHSLHLVLNTSEPPPCSLLQHRAAVSVSSFIMKTHRTNPDQISAKPRDRLPRCARFSFV